MDPLLHGKCAHKPALSEEVSVVGLLIWFWHPVNCTRGHLSEEMKTLLGDTFLELWNQNLSETVCVVVKS